MAAGESLRTSRGRNSPPPHYPMRQLPLPHRGVAHQRHGQPRHQLSGRHAVGFDVQQAVLLRTREKLEALQAKVAQLEAQLAGSPATEAAPPASQQPH